MFGNSFTIDSGSEVGINYGDKLLMGRGISLRVTGRGIPRLIPRIFDFDERETNFNML